jgi:hypothetical protein
MSTHSSNTPDGHDASDRKLDKEAFTEVEAEADRPRQDYDPAEVRKHDDPGRDRLFADRQQHDEADKNSEKTRRARDVQRHHHDVDDDVADSGSGPTGKRKG